MDIWSICGNLLHIQRILSIPPAADRHTAHVRERMRARVEGWSADDCWLGFLAGTACVQDMLCAVDCLALVSPRIFSTLIARSNSLFRGLCLVANEKSDLRPCIKWMVRCSSLCLWNLAQCLWAIASTSEPSLPIVPNGVSSLSTGVLSTSPAAWDTSRIGNARLMRDLNGVPALAAKHARTWSIRPRSRVCSSLCITCCICLHAAFE